MRAANIKLYDNPTEFYKNFLKRFFDNVYESLSLRDFLGRLSDAPVLGPLLKPFLGLYASRLHAAALPLPLPQTPDVIHQTKVIAVDECICRNLWHNRDRPRRTCFLESLESFHKNSTIHEFHVLERRKRNE